MKPKMIMLVGLPGSGKTCWAKQFVNDYKIHSSNELREELFNNVNEQKKNKELFEELHRRIIEDLKNGQSVIYDATNMNKKKRIGFIKTLPPCDKTCVLFLTPIEECIENTTFRERKVPEEIIYKMRKNFCPPYYHEGFDSIVVVQQECSNEVNLLRKTVSFDQKNKHHSMFLYDHLNCAREYACNHNMKKEVIQAAANHDIGKIFTREQGEDGECHYFNHENVGAYEFLSFKDVNSEKDSYLYVANLIYFHMRPYLSWKDSQKAMERDHELIGDTMFNDVLKVHEADKSAH